MNSKSLHSLLLSFLALAGAATLPAQEARLANLATRGQTGTGAEVLTAGFVIGPGPNKQVVIRAIGPTLSAFGLSGLLADPFLTLINASTQATVATNDNWLAADAATMAAAGAFALPANSKDAVIVATLPPGGYTAQISGVGGTTGLTIAEVYEVGGTGAKLINISSRGPVGTGANVMIPGIVVAPGTGNRKFLVRAAGPALAAFGLTGTLADPQIVVTNSAGTLTYASNNDWGTPVGLGASTAAQLTSSFTANGAFAFAPGSKDAALTVDLAAGNYTIAVSGVGGTSGLAIVEIYDITPVGPPSITVSASIASADKSGSKPGEFTFTRGGDTTSAVNVVYSLGGSAVNGFTYAPLLGTITLPAGATSAKLAVTPNPALLATGVQTAVLTVLTAGNAYTIGAANTATVSIADSPATLYVSNLRPAPSVSGSSATGTATILVNPAGTLASVSVSFSGLTSALTGSHLQIGPSGDFVLDLPTGQATNVTWAFQPRGTYTSAALLEALKSGNIYVGLDTANNPSGEVRGTFIVGSGAQNFVVPAAPPALPAGLPTSTEAARFLTQATYGPLRTEIAVVQAQGYNAWIDAQMALPYTPHRPATVSDFRVFGGQSNGGMSPANRQAAWWKNSLTAPDQLRQRVALALSEILVVSDGNSDGLSIEGIANYYDILGNGAFGNFRDLLQNVSLSPIMAIYLSSLRNSKATFDSSGGTLTTPDENYAREVMQLFSVGLYLLLPDGTLKFDPTGLPIPTYNQNIVTEMAKVFTGWAYPSTNLTQFRNAPADYFTPLQLFPSFHDDTQKSILNGVVLPAGQGGTKDLQQALDALFSHPNTGPFISKQLIQRLVTSNPTPAYVYRVAQKFENNGSGTRGDLSAVVRAVLTDYEARSATSLAAPNFGKLREPLIRATALLRSFGATPASRRYSSGLSNPESALAQAALRSPTVFNFFRPDYVLPGALAAAGLVAPEYEITDATYAISVPNFLRTFIFNTVGTNPDTVVLNLSYEQSLVATPSALLDHLNQVMCGGNLTAATRTRVTTMLAALPSTTSTLERAQRTILVLATSPDGSVQK
jgi:uncharacterized protein (DUF1800 family)